METSVKWNLAEATEVMIITDSRVIEFKKAHISGGWVDNSIDPPQRFNNDNLQNLLNGYALAGYVPLVVAPKKQEPLKLGTKMVEVSTKKFNWDDVGKIHIYRNGYECLKYENANESDVEGMPIFKLKYRFDQKSSFTKSSSDWYVYEVENDITQSNTTEVIIFNKDGERMNYEQN
jgi:hypothetical protein